MALIQEVEKQWEQQLPEIKWMDAQTRDLAIQKLKKIKNKIGYTDKPRDYSQLQPGSSYFTDAVAARKYNHLVEVAKIGTSVDKEEWVMTAQTVNAYYDPSKNEIAFPAGILQPPFFDPKAPAGANYGGIGVIMGHEITHGFDDTGRKYDGDGTLREWWTEEVSTKFQEAANCIATQYDKYQPLPNSPDVHVIGNLTLGENIADFGGVRSAFSAFMSNLKSSTASSSPVTSTSTTSSDPVTSHWPVAFAAGDSPAKQFFLNFAQAWCQVAKDESVKVQTNTDPHSPAKFRVNGPLSHSMAFREAFQCKEGDAMVAPEGSRCEVW